MQAQGTLTHHPPHLSPCQRATITEPSTNAASSSWIRSKKERAKTHELLRAVGQLRIATHQHLFSRVCVPFRRQDQKYCIRFHPIHSSFKTPRRTTATAILLQSNRRMDVTIVLVQHRSHSPARQNKSSVDQPGKRRTRVLPESRRFSWSSNPWNSARLRWLSHPLKNVFLGGSSSHYIPLCLKTKYLKPPDPVFPSNASIPRDENYCKEVKTECFHLKYEVIFLTRKLSKYPKIDRLVVII